MRLVDANVLLYAVNDDSQHHDAARRWLDDALSGGGTVAFCWVALLAFIRISTNPTIFSSPLTVEDAGRRVEAWLTASGAVVLHPGPDHGRLVMRLLSAAAGGGNLVNDAHLAALAVANGASVVTFDRDFARFEGIRIERPAA